MITATVPNKLTLLITHRCNQACEFCFDASSVLRSDLADMSLETVDRILAMLQAAGKATTDFNITLSGGEPTIHSRFLEILERISRCGFSITILSNGLRFADKAFMEEVLLYRIWNLQFSVEGANPETHDARVGHPGAWTRLIRAIRNAQELGVRFITNTTMTRMSVNEMFELIDFLDKLQVPKINIGNTLPECAGRNYPAMMEYPEVVDIAEMLTLYAFTKRPAFTFITPLPFCLKEGRVISNPSVCSAGRYSLVMDTDGTFRPCSVCSPPEASLPRLGQINAYGEAHDRLDDIVTTFVRSDVPDECNRCPRLNECKACCPLYWKVPGVKTPTQWPEALPTPTSGMIL